MHIDHRTKSTGLIRTAVDTASRTKALTIVLIALALGACATSNIAIQPAVSDQEGLPEGHGIVLLQIADTTPMGRVYPITQATFAAKDVNVEEGKLPRSIAREEFGRSTQLFITALPANEYSLTSLRTYYHMGDSYVSRFYPADVELGTFEVRPGSVTDLGTVAVYIDRRGEDYRYESARVAGNPRSLEYLSNQLPLISQQLSNISAPLGWTQDGQQSERNLKYRRATNRQIVSQAPHVNRHTGELTYPSRLGMILKRNADREWSREAFEEDVELSHITEVNGQTIIVTEFGELHFRSVGQSSWKRGTDLPTDEEISYIGSYDGRILALTQGQESATVWSADDLSSKWVERRTLSAKLGFWSQLNNALSVNVGSAGSSAIRAGDKLYLAIADTMYRYDMTSNEFVDLRTAKVKSLQSRNGNLTVTAQGFLANTNRVSFDNGETWSNYLGDLKRDLTEREKARWKSQPSRNPFPKIQPIGHPIFLNRKTAFAVHAKPENNRKDAKLVSKFIRTDDSGESWWEVEGSELPEGCLDLEIANESEILLGCFLNGEVYRSTDGGKTFEIEREVSDT